MRLLLFALLGSLLAQDAPAPPPTETVPIIAPADLKRLLEGPHPPLVVDVRDDAELAAEGALVPPYRLIPLSDLAARAAELPKDRTIITFCRTARRADAAAALLQAQGFRVTARAGIKPWKERAYEVQYPARPK